MLLCVEKQGSLLPHHINASKYDSLQIQSIYATILSNLLGIVALVGVFEAKLVVLGQVWVFIKFLFFSLVHFLLPP